MSSDLRKNSSIGSANLQPKNALVEFRHVSKIYPQSTGDFWALREVSFSIRPGSLHALIGENGAGKSTLMKILFGLTEPTLGELRHQGQSVKINSPAKAKELGIAMVQQHFTLAKNLSALDHILLERSPAGWGLSVLPKKSAMEKVEHLAAELQMPIPWGSEVNDLSVGEQQRLELLKVLQNDPNLLILDEPTALLSPMEVQQLFTRLRALCAKGRSVVVISHKLNEVLSYCDDVTVLRQGRVVWSGATSVTNASDLAARMVGSAVMEHVTPSLQRVSKLSTPPLFQWKGSSDSAHGPQDGFELAVHAGEIVGIAGVEGSGQIQLVEEVLRQRSQIGEIGVLHPDRLSQAVVPEWSATENFVLGHAGKYSRGPIGRIDWKLALAECQSCMDEFDVQPAYADRKLRDFSGGNQQKFVVGRELWHRPKMLLACYPTRGVDLRSTHYLHHRILLARSEGVGILLISSDLDELCALSDRLFVFYGGRIVGTQNVRTKNIEKWNLTEIGRWMGGDIGGTRK